MTENQPLQDAPLDQQQRYLQALARKRGIELPTDAGYPNAG